MVLWRPVGTPKQQGKGCGAEFTYTKYSAGLLLHSVTKITNTTVKDCSIINITNYKNEERNLNTRGFSLINPHTSIYIFLTYSPKTLRRNKD